MIRWLPALGAGLIAVWLSYGRPAGGAHRWPPVTALVAALRAAAVTLLAALLLGAPLGKPRPVAPLVAIDVSASVRRGAGDDSTRLRRWRREVDSALQQVDASAPIIGVGDSLRELSGDRREAWRPEDGASRVRAAVDRAASQGRPLVLVTDGEIDDPEALAEAPAGSRLVPLARAARADVGIAALEAPTVATAGDTIKLTVTLASGPVATEAMAVHLRLDGGEVAALPVPPLAPEATTRVAASVLLPRGERPLRLEVVREGGVDLEPRNDTLATVIDVRDRPSAVFVSTAPDLDVREVLVVLRGALDIPTRAYLRLAPGVWRVEGTLAPIAEAEVRARALAAGMVILHGDTSWLSTGSAGRSSPSSLPGSLPAARALWLPAPPTAAARAGEVARASEWYVQAVPSPLDGVVGALPVDSLPPITLAPPSTGAQPAKGSATRHPVVTARLGKRGNAVPAISLEEQRGARLLTISGSGYAGWALRGGRSREAFTALWGALFDWLAAGRGDPRAARPAAGSVRAGEPVPWRRGGADSVVAVTIRRREGTGTARALTVRFPAEAMETATTPLPPGEYEVTAPGGTSRLVVNPSAEWVPRPVTAGRPMASASTTPAEAPPLVDRSWPFVVILLLLSTEWLVRRYGGHR